MILPPQLLWSSTGFCVRTSIISSVHVLFRQYYYQTLQKCPLLCRWHPAILGYKTNQSNSSMSEGHEGLDDLNFLHLNSDKTEVLVFGPKRLRNTLSNRSYSRWRCLSLQFYCYKPSRYFDQDTSFNTDIKAVCRTAFFHLQSIVKIRNILSLSDDETLICTFRTSRLDYCDSLWSGCLIKSLKNLQLILNAAARVLTSISFSSSTPRKIQDRI